MTKRVLCIITDGFEEIETVAPVDLLRRAGAEVVVAAIGDGIHVTGRCHITMHADARLDDVKDQHFDMLLIPGGPHVAALRADGRAAALAKSYAAAGRPVAAICAAPTVLKDAGLLEGRRHTSHVGVAEELPARIADEHVVEDRGVITSMGAGTSVEFGLRLILALFDQAKVAEVSRGIML
ncbi:MAG: DJ-1/PfpI family protein [Verrucomicrobiaceae bacterium]|nr:DJ-1/PfpI family protein [Verrucomicrobiaceae bacterium]